MRRITLTAFLVTGLAVAYFAQEPRGAIERNKSEDVMVSFKCPSGEPEQVRPELKMSLGDVTKKARVLPKPKYPREAKIAKISGIVRAEVVIDIHLGDVVWAKIDNGHPLLREAVKEVVCRAQFYPTLINSPPIRVGGIITYRFGRP